MGSTTNIVLIAIVAGVVIFAVVSAILGHKNSKLEKTKKKKEVIIRIKEYLKNNNDLKHVEVEYKKIVARKGKEYKYRDIFDVVVDVKAAKTKNFICSKAFEIEGKHRKISKKNQKLFEKLILN